MGNYAKVAQMLDEKDKEIERLQRDLDYWVAQAQRVDAERRKLETALRLIERTASQYSGRTWVRVEDIAKEALGDG